MRPVVASCSRVWDSLPGAACLGLAAVGMFVGLATLSAQTTYRTENAFPGLTSFNQPLGIASVPGETDRVFIVDAGRVTVAGTVAELTAGERSLEDVFLAHTHGASR